MDNIVYSLANYAYEHPVVTLILSLITAAIIMSHAHLSKQLCNYQNCCNSYDYGPERGPHTWQVEGQNQSPININTGLVQITNMHEHLMWNHYNDLPTTVTLENNGRTVILKAKYAANTPTISGADLFHSYTFESLCFHWSFWNTEGSEHTIDTRSYPMELQAIHTSGSVLPCTINYNTLIIAYFFQITAHNPFLDPVILNLHRIREPGSIVKIPSFPLAWLCYRFRSGFYSYGGSRTIPPCEEGVEWFLNSEPMTISENQLKEFRKLLSSDGSSRIIRNSRPVQNLNDHRTVQFNQYEPVGNNCGFPCDLQPLEDRDSGDD